MKILLKLIKVLHKLFLLATVKLKISLPKLVLLICLFVFLGSKTLIVTEISGWDEKVSRDLSLHVRPSANTTLAMPKNLNQRQVFQ